MTLTSDNRRYAFIFNDEEEFRQAFPAEDISSRKFELNTLRDILKAFKRDAYILNVSSHNMYLTKRFLNGLELPSEELNSKGAYSSDEFKALMDSADNGELEEFIENSKDASRLFEIISSSRLFAMVLTDRDMDILENDGTIDTLWLDIQYDFYIYEQYVCLFTSRDRLRDVEASGFRYLFLVDFPSIVHYSIKNEFKGIIINPGDESYIIPIEILFRN